MTRPINININVKTVTFFQKISLKYFRWMECVFLNINRECELSPNHLSKKQCVTYWRFSIYIKLINNRSDRRFDSIRHGIIVFYIYLSNFYTWTSRRLGSPKNTLSLWLDRKQKVQRSPKRILSNTRTE